MLEQCKDLDSSIGFRDKDILCEFSQTQILSTYKIYAEFKRGPMGKAMAYKNVHGHVKKLESLGFIEPVKRKDTKHGAIYYRISEAGMFKLFQHAPSTLFLPSILGNHETYSIFKTFLYPYFKKETLTSMRLTEGYGVGKNDEKVIREISEMIIEYLRNCCMKIYRFVVVIIKNPAPSKPREGLLAILDKHVSNDIAQLKDALVMRILLCLRDPEEKEKMNVLSILVHDEKFIKIARDLQLDINRSLDIATRTRNES
jgi:hypothetical protein